MFGDVHCGDAPCGFEECGDEQLDIPAIRSLKAGQRKLEELELHSCVSCTADVLNAVAAYDGGLKRLRLFVID